MPIVIDEKKKIIWIAPPKNACSTIRLLVGKNNFKDIVYKDDNTIYDYKFESLIEEYLKDKQKLKQMRIIFIFRDPVERFYSFLNNVLYSRVNIKNPDNYKHILNSFWEKYINLFEIEFGKNICIDTNILEIIKFQNILKTKYELDRSIDSHGFPQYFFMNNFLELFGNTQKQYIEIIDINNLDIILTNLYDQSFKKNISKDYECINDKKKKLEDLTLKDIVHNKDYNNKELNELISKLYEDDYTLLHHNFT